jgi:hypothetical protein
MTGYESKRAAARDKMAPPEQESVTWGVDWGKSGDTPCVVITKHLPNGVSEIIAVEYGPQRPWVGLTAEEATKCCTISAIQTWFNFENALRIKNT